MEMAKLQSEIPSCGTEVFPLTRDGVAARRRRWKHLFFSI